MKLINILLLLTTSLFADNSSKSNIYNEFYYDHTSNGTEYGKIEITRFYLNVYSSNNYNHFLFKNTDVSDCEYSIISTNSDTIHIDETSREIQINDKIYYINSNLNLNW